MRRYFILQHVNDEKNGIDSAFCIPILVFNRIIQVKSQMDRLGQVLGLFCNLVGEFFDLCWDIFPSTVEIKIDFFLILMNKETQ